MEKIFFFDIDGTLIDHKYGIQEIPLNVKSQLKRLKKQGYGLFIASGRPLAFLPDKILEVGFDGYVLCNGAHVIVNNQTIYENCFEYIQLKELVHMLEENNIEYDLETSDHCYFDEKYVDLIAFFKQFGINENKIIYKFDKEKVLKKTLKIELNTTKEQSDIIKSYIKGKFLYDNHGTDNAYEIYDIHTSKAKGIKQVLKYLGIPVANSYAFGDGLNDLEMIQYVGCGIAMGNAIDNLKQVADKKIGHIKDDGLAKFLMTID